MTDYNLSHLEELESESIFILREVAAQFEKPTLLFSGGKDSIVCYHLARKAFFPANVPFPLMHVDTGHNFDELYEFRDKLINETGARLIIASVQESIDQGKVTEEKGLNASRNKLQTTTLLDAIESNKFDSIFTVYKSSAVEWIEEEDLWNRKDNINGSQSRRQNRPPKYHECGVFYATKVKNITDKSILGEKCHCIVVDSIEALDINSPLDLEVCRTVFNQLNEA